MKETSAIGASVRMMRRYFVLMFIVSYPLFPCAAQTTFLSREGLQIPDIVWHVLATAHASIYYLPETDELARRAASIAEEAYTEFASDFRLQPEEKLEFAVTACYPYPEKTNALGERLPQELANVVGYPQEHSIIRFEGSLPHFRSAVRQEIARSFIRERIKRALSEHEPWSWGGPPDWFVDGLAGYYGGGRDVRATMILRDAVLNDRLIPLGRLGGVEDPLLRATFAESAVEYLREILGGDGLLHILDSVWTSWSFQSILREKTGKEFDELSTEWHYRLQKRFFPSLRSEDLPSGLSESLAAGGFNSAPVLFEEDTLHLLLFKSTRNGLPGVYVRSLQSQDPRDYGRLLIECGTSDRITRLRSWRARMSVSSSGLLAFSGSVGKTEAIQIFDIREAELREPILLARFTEIGSLSWSPDGRHLALCAMDSSGKYDLYQLDIVTDSLKALTTDYFDDRDPAWSPDGRSIVFSSDRTPSGEPGTEHLFLYDVSNGSISQLTGGEQTDESPAWTQDGRAILFTNDRGSVRNICELRFMGKGGDAQGGAHSDTIYRLTEFALPVFDPVRTSGGDLVFSAFEGGSFCIDRLPARKVKADSVAAHTSPVPPASSGGPTPDGVPAETSTASQLPAPYRSAFSQASVTTNPIRGNVGGFLFSAWNVPADERFTLQAMGGPAISTDPLSEVGAAVSSTHHGQRFSTEYALYYYADRQSTRARPDSSYRESLLGAYGLFGVPVGTFHRFELSTDIAYTHNVDPAPTGRANYLLVSASAAYVFDNTLWEGAGPIDGRSLHVSFSLTDDILHQTVRYLSIITDLRDYLRLGLHSALASRLWLFYNQGTNCRRYAMGGSWDLRGYAQGSLQGEKLWLLSEELRFPFFDFLGLQSPFAGVTFWQVRGALTFDVGEAWDKDYLNSQASFGFGLRMSLGQVITFRWDVGKRIENNLSHLQHGLYSNLFFGWDF